MSHSRDTVSAYRAPFVEPDYDCSDWNRPDGEALSWADIKAHTFYAETTETLVGELFPLQSYPQSLSTWKRMCIVICGR